MRCRKCGIQLTANTIDACPHCGPTGENKTPDLQGIFWPLKFALLANGLFSAIIAFFVFQFTGSLLIAGLCFGLVFVFVLVLPFLFVFGE